MCCNGRRWNDSGTFDLDRLNVERRNTDDSAEGVCPDQTVPIPSIGNPPLLVPDQPSVLSQCDKVAMLQRVEKYYSLRKRGVSRAAALVKAIGIIGSNFRAAISESNTIRLQMRRDLDLHRWALTKHLVNTYKEWAGPHYRQGVESDADARDLPGPIKHEVMYISNILSNTAQHS
jgi:hypothetical protein